ncbi:hypothetical protein WJT86_08490 [Microvirga sp. W0021]|uniref:Uncharacterized protein n=1 Tax=Hohaiivirga grylli TaxID=3133970 RepID=A0ABV0BJB6_9HYPH
MLKSMPDKRIVSRRASGSAGLIRLKTIFVLLALLMWFVQPIAAPFLSSAQAAHHPHDISLMHNEQIQNCCSETEQSQHAMPASCMQQCLSHCSVALPSLQADVVLMEADVLFSDMKRDLHSVAVSPAVPPPRNFS